MNNAFRKIAEKGRVVACLSLLAVILLGAYFSLAFRGLDTKTMLDTTFNFSATHMYTVLNNYSPAQHNHYVVAEIIDFAVMIFVSLVQALVIFKAFAATRWGGKLHYLPLAALLLNSLKDMAMLAALVLLPKESAYLAHALNIINMAKTIAVDASLGLTLIAAVALFVRRTKR